MKSKQTTIDGSRPVVVPDIHINGAFYVHGKQRYHPQEPIRRTCQRCGYVTLALSRSLCSNCGFELQATDKNGHPLFDKKGRPVFNQTVLDEIDLPDSGR
jgi:ribosomal protein L37E